MFNRSISLTDFEGQLIGFILYNRLSTNSGHYISMVKVGDIWFECDDVTITKIEFNTFCNSDTVYYCILWHQFMWYTGMWSPNGDQSGQWKINQYYITMVSHYDITMCNYVTWDVHCELTMGNDIDRDIHCNITMINDIAMYTYHGITMHDDVTMNLSILYFLLYA